MGTSTVLPGAYLGVQTLQLDEKPAQVWSYSDKSVKCVEVLLHHCLSPMSWDMDVGTDHFRTVLSASV